MNFQHQKMDQNFLGYGYTPIYHQLQNDQFGIENSNEIQHQVISSTPSTLSNEFGDLVMVKREESPTSSRPPPQYLPSIFNHHPYQSMGWESNFNYQYHQYNPINYQPPPPPPPHHFDPRFMTQSPIQYGANTPPIHSNGYPSQSCSYQQNIEGFKPIIVEGGNGVVSGDGYFNQPTTSSISISSIHPIKPSSSLHCAICDKNFTTSTHYKRHLQTKSHQSRVPSSNHLDKDPVIIKTGNRSFQITFSEQQLQQQQNNPITDLSEAEIVMIDKIDKELSSIEPSMLNLEDDKTKIVILTNPSPLPVVSSSSSSSQLDGEFNCGICNKNFAKKCYLTQHNKTAHCGTKPFKCVKCGKKYETNEALENHLTKHGNDKPFKCTFGQCSKAFIHKTDLKRHVILHSAEKPHSCQQCGKGFIRKDHLMKHIQSHQKKMEKMQKIFTMS